MRILVSTPTFLPMVGGAELGIHEIYRRVGERHEVRILAPPPPSAATGHVVSDQSSDAYEVRRLLPEVDRIPGSLSRKILRRTPAAYAFELSRQIREFAPDIVNAQFIQRQGLAVGWAAHAHRVPLVLSLVGRGDVLAEQSPILRAYSRSVLNQADFVVANSGYYLGGYSPRSPYSVIPYGVDLAAYTPSRRSNAVRNEWGVQEDSTVFVTLGRLAPVKRTDLVIQALALARERGADCRLVVIGRGPEEERLRALVREQRLDGAVIFAGYVSEEDLPGQLASADAFAFHSMAETFGIVFVQAMASALPIVAAATSCVPEVVGSSGRLVTPGDLAEFASAMLAIAGDKRGAREQGALNRARAETTFDWDVIARDYELMFDQVLG